jgi:hypothetical protein
MIKSDSKRKIFVSTVIVVLALGLLSPTVYISFSPVVSASPSDFALRGASVTANCFAPNSQSYYLNAWELLKSAGVNWIRIGGGTEGDINHFNMKNYPNEWAQNLDNFLSQAASYGIKVSFGSLGNTHDTLLGIRSPGTAAYTDPYAPFTPIAEAKAMMTSLPATTA